MFNPLRGWSLSLFLYPQFYWGLCTVNPLGVKKELPQAPKGDVKSEMRIDFQLLLLVLRDESNLTSPFRG